MGGFRSPHVDPRFKKRSLVYYGDEEDKERKDKKIDNYEIERSRDCRYDSKNDFNDNFYNESKVSPDREDKQGRKLKRTYSNSNDSEIDDFLDKKQEKRAPTKTLVFQGLDDNLTRFEVISKLDTLKVPYKDISFIHGKKQNNDSYAFVKFDSIKEAQDFMESIDPEDPLTICDCKVKVVYSKDKNIDAKEDWKCLNCFKFNFSFREECFFCAKVRKKLQPVAENHGLNDISETATCYIIVLNISPETTEEEFFEFSKNLSKDVKRILLIRDRSTKESLKYGFIEFDTLTHSSLALSNFNPKQEYFKSMTSNVILKYASFSIFVPDLNITPSEYSILSRSGTHLLYWDKRAFFCEFPKQSNKDEKNINTDDRNDKNKDIDNNDKLLKKKTYKPTKSGLIKQKKVSISISKNISSAPQLMKWQNRQKELREGDDDVRKNPKGFKFAFKNMSNDGGNGNGIINNESQEVDNESYFDNDRLICLLCLRKFELACILDAHKRLSDLHRENLSNKDKCAEARKRIK